jgi:hypothetical protein
MNEHTQERQEHTGLKQADPVEIVSKAPGITIMFTSSQ